MKATFDRLKKIFADYKQDVDALAPLYAKDAAPDASYNEQIRAERAAARSADYNARIDRLAKKAQADATEEIRKLREAVWTYCTSSSDPVTLQTLQALLSAGWS